MPPGVSLCCDCDLNYASTGRGSRPLRSQLCARSRTAGPAFSRTRRESAVTPAVMVVTVELIVPLADPFTPVVID